MSKENMENNNPEKIMEEVLNGLQHDPTYWKHLDEARKKQWIEHFKYGDLFVPLFPNSKDPFPQPPL